MAVSVGFAVKHIRPFGDGFDAFCTDDLIQFLFSLNFAPSDVVEILAEWRRVSQTDPEGHSDVFVAAAKAVAMARWTELYRTSESSLMFLDADQLASLSLAGQQAGRNRQFTWNYGDDLPICVSINHDSGAYHVHWDARGCVAGTDGHGNVNHFVSLV